MLALVVATGLAIASCGQDDEPDEARVLWEKVHAGPGYPSWSRAPGHATRMPSLTAHANAVDIWVNPEMSRALAGPHIPEWPLGSIVVKEGYSGSSLKLVAIMEKRATGWFWAEYDSDGGSLFSGRPSVCIDCHDNRKTYSDWVYSFELPR